LPLAQGGTVFLMMVRGRISPTASTGVNFHRRWKNNSMAFPADFVPFFLMRLAH